MKKTIKGIIKPSELAPFIKSGNALNAFIIVSLYTLAFGFIYISHKLDMIAVTILCAILMTAIQHTFVTFIHEAAHGHAFSNKKLNDLLGHFFYAAPFMCYLEDYRYLHWEHHRHTGKIEKDPEMDLYRFLDLKPEGFTKKEIMVVFIKSITGYMSLKGVYYLNRFYMKNRKAGNIPNPGIIEHAGIAFWWGVLPFIMWEMGLLGTFLLVWLLPMCTITTVLLIWHGFGEHIREKDTCLCENTFTHKFDIVTTLFLYPINSGYHLEHHLYPQLPWHAMVKFRKWAEQNPEYKKLATELEADGYFFGQKTIVDMSFPRQA